MLFVMVMELFLRLFRVANAKVPEFVEYPILFLTVMLEMVSPVSVSTESQITISPMLCFVSRSGWS